MMRLSEAVVALNERGLSARYFGEDVLFTSVGMDSRNIAAGQLFVALKGEKFDGHAYAEAALKEGAAAVMVNQADSALHAALVVDDTYQALGQLAAYWRSRFLKPIIAVTGSNGKTTVKEMLSSILSVATSNKDQVLATVGNLNNHIGLPLTLLKLKPEHQYAVVEMGMNHRGEIRYLTQLAKPNVVVINNAGNAHLGELGSYEAIAQAKGEIIEGLAEDGIAVLNADDQFYPLWRALAGSKRVMTFGLEGRSQHQADVSASYTLKSDASEIAINTPMGDVNISLPSPGVHNVMNALAATTAALAVGISISTIKQGLENFKGAKGRLQYYQVAHGVVIDDSYNANPMSMKAAIDVLSEHTGPKLLVLGDMGELGEAARQMHADIGKYAKAAGIDALYTFGELSVEMTNAFGQGARHYTALAPLIVDVQHAMQNTSTVLVKGSRFMAMERVVDGLVNTSQQIIKTQNQCQESIGEAQ